jgi:hypothetical protein
MVFVKGGSFIMGCTSEQNNCNGDELPAHRVTVSDFYIGKDEVTQAHWAQLMGTSIRQQRDKADPNESICGEGANYPMYYISWEEAQKFIERLNAATGKRYRLPTEAEWEYAARGGNQSKGYRYAGSNSSGDVAWFDGNSGESTHPVGTKTANELGIYDMSGNVLEWCYDWYDDYSSSSQTNPTGASSGSNRVLRGGSWYFYAQYCRVALRNSRSPGIRNSVLGFRLVLSSEQKESATSGSTASGNTIDHSSSPSASASSTASYLTTDGTNFTFDSDGINGRTITVSTDGSSWEVSLLPSWCSVKDKTGNSFRLVVNPNSGAARSDWFKVKSGNKEVRIDVKQTAGKQTTGTKGTSAQIENIWVDHNIMNGNYRGMKIHVKFSVSGMLNKQGKCVAWFYFADGTKLKDYNGSYRTSDNQVSTSAAFKSTYEDSIWNDFTFFMPYTELHLSAGQHHLKFCIGLFDHNDNQLITSDYISFSLSN